MIEKLYKTNNLTRNELINLINENRKQLNVDLLNAAVQTRKKHYGDEVIKRGLIEFTNYCKNDCFYCGIRRSNKKVCRYRLTKEEILDACEEGYKLGFGTFVLQGGEDSFYTDDIMVDLIKTIKARYPDWALTLSFGEKSYDTYKKYYDAGVDRYLLRHETATDEHYNKLHPSKMSLAVRKQALYDLKEIGFQVGAGFMVESPYQTTENLADDLLFLKELEPDMVGLGPFISHKDTIFAKEKHGSLEMTLLMLALVRLLLPKVLLPATTALETIDPRGRDKGYLAGANVVMINISPDKARENYLLYDR